MLNRDAQKEPPKEEMEDTDQPDISVGAPTIQEIKTAPRVLRNGKDSGAYQISADMLKADLPEN